MGKIVLVEFLSLDGVVMQAPQPFVGDSRRYMPGAGAVAEAS